MSRTRQMRYKGQRRMMPEGPRAERSVASGRWTGASEAGSAVWVGCSRRCRRAAVQHASDGGRQPLDDLFHSLVEEYGSHSVGNVLSGEGCEGIGGVHEIKAAGGLTIARKADGAGQPALPRRAIEAGGIDLVLTIDEGPGILIHAPRELPECPHLPSSGCAEACAAGAPFRGALRASRIRKQIHRHHERILWETI